MIPALFPKSLYKAGLRVFSILALAVGFAVGSIQAATGAAEGTVTPAASPQRNSERNAYFGETHIHTSWS